MKVLDQSGQPKVLPADFIPFIPRARAYMNANQSMPNGGPNFLVFDREEFDTDNMHDLVTNPTRITIKTAGVYLVTAQIAWASATLGSVRDAVVRKNGVSNVISLRDAPPGAGNAQFFRSMTDVLELVVGDYLELGVTQDSGGAVNVFGGLGSSNLTVTYIGPGFQSARAKAQVFYVTPAQFAAITPIDGDEAYITVDATNGVIWHMRYNAGSASAFKWEWLGGSKLPAFATGGALGAASTSVNSSGSMITLPRGGDYEIEFTAGLYDAGSAGSEQMSATVRKAGVALPSFTGRPSVNSNVTGVAGNNIGADLTGSVIALSATAGEILSVWGFGLKSGSIVQNISMRVRPVRIS